MGACGRYSNHQQPQHADRTMTSLATFINVVAFTALFTAHASAAPVERPAGVRRALQIYAGELTNGRSITLEPMLRLDGTQFFCTQHGESSTGTRPPANLAVLPCGRRISVAA
ncbi:hypothetical protein USDA257_c05620 [Sinorhizobium fredii USDA 257]|uniref:Uncharacterized protein n=2 Tax=Rhizobium fredii TaxID=380 RepID=I3WZV1_SINF2|nr:hypothetical protein USDA257_c05620 [Sinorhizobium fredii USDA 257]